MLASLIKNSQNNDDISKNKQTSLPKEIRTRGMARREIYNRMLEIDREIVKSKFDYPRILVKILYDYHITVLKLLTIRIEKSLEIDISICDKNIKKEEIIRKLYDYLRSNILIPFLEQINSMKFDLKKIKGKKDIYNFERHREVVLSYYEIAYAIYSLEKSDEISFSPIHEKYSSIIRNNPRVIRGWKFQVAVNFAQVISRNHE